MEVFGRDGRGSYFFQGAERGGEGQGQKSMGRGGEGKPFKSAGREGAGAGNILRISAHICKGNLNLHCIIK